MVLFVLNLFFGKEAYKIYIDGYLYSNFRKAALGIVHSADHGTYQKIVTDISFSKSRLVSGIHNTQF